MTLAYVGVGSNLDEPRRQVEAAFAEIDRLPHTRLVRKSPLYRSAPLGYAEQPEFVNAVAQIETGLAAERLLAELQGIEARHGRQRSFPNAPRTLDLDVLLFGNTVLRTPTLVLPHPRMHERAFVLRPLLDLDATVDIPAKGRARELLARLGSQKVEKIVG